MPTSQKKIIRRSSSPVINARKTSSIESNNNIMLIPIAEIVVKAQSRKVFEQYSIKALANNIQTNGLLNPIIINKTKTGKLVLIAGERRLRAYQFLNKEEKGKGLYVKINANIHNNLSATKANKLHLVENFARESLTRQEQYDVFKPLLEEGMTKKEICNLLGISYETGRKQISRIITAIEKLNDKNSTLTTKIDEKGQCPTTPDLNQLKIEDYNLICSLTDTSRNKSTNKIFELKDLSDKQISNIDMVIKKAFITLFTPEEN